MKKSLCQYIKESIDADNVIYLLDIWTNNNDKLSNDVIGVIDYYILNKKSKNGLCDFLMNECNWTSNNILEFINLFNNDATGAYGIDNPNNVPVFNDDNIIEFQKWCDNQLSIICSLLSSNQTYQSRIQKNEQLNESLEGEGFWAALKKFFKKLFSFDKTDKEKYPDDRFYVYKDQYYDNENWDEFTNKLKDNTTKTTVSSDKPPLSITDFDPKITALSLAKNTPPLIIQWFPCTNKVLNNAKLNNGIYIDSKNDIEYNLSNIWVLTYVQNSSKDTDKNGNRIKFDDGRTIGILLFGNQSKNIEPKKEYMNMLLLEVSPQVINKEDIERMFFDNFVKNTMKEKKEQLNKYKWITCIPSKESMMSEVINHIGGFTKKDKINFIKKIK